MASGLGSLRVAALGAALLAKPSLRVPWTTLKLTAAPVNATIGTPLTITAVTNNVLIGTPYHINIFVAGKLFATCKWTRTGVCHENLFPRPPFPAPYRRDCPRNCVGTNERDVHAYYHEKQDAEEQDRYRAGAARPGA
jgi:hypothetical protein